MCKCSYKMVSKCFEAIRLLLIHSQKGSPEHRFLRAHPVNHEVDRVRHFGVDRSFGKVPQNNLLKHKGWHQPEAVE